MFGRKLSISEKLARQMWDIGEEPPRFGDTPAKAAARARDQSVFGVDREGGFGNRLFDSMGAATNIERKDRP